MHDWLSGWCLRTAAADGAGGDAEVHVIDVNATLITLIWITIGTDRLYVIVWPLRHPYPSPDNTLFGFSTTALWITKRSKTKNQLMLRVLEIEQNNLQWLTKPLTKLGAMAKVIRNRLRVDACSSFAIQLWLQHMTAPVSSPQVLLLYSFSNVDDLWLGTVDERLWKWARSRIERETISTCAKVAPSSTSTCTLPLMIIN